MALRNTKTSYGVVAIAVHWLFAVTVFGLFGLGLYMVELTYYDPDYKTAPDLHRSIGVVLTALLLFRIAWRWRGPAPDPEPGGAPWEAVVAHRVHMALYLLPAALMISGYLISTADGRPVSVFGWVDIPALLPPSKGRETTAGLVHEWLAYALIAVTALHALAAVKHHVRDRDRTLIRMIGGRGTPVPPSPQKKETPR